MHFNEAFQALWIEIHFVNNKTIYAVKIYTQHNCLDHFMSYFDETIGN